MRLEADIFFSRGNLAAESVTSELTTSWKPYTGGSSFERAVSILRVTPVIYDVIVSSRSLFTANTIVRHRWSSQIRLVRNS